MKELLELIKQKGIRSVVLGLFLFIFIGLPAFGQMTGTNMFAKLDALKWASNIMFASEESSMIMEPQMEEPQDESETFMDTTDEAYNDEYKEEDDMMHSDEHMDTWQDWEEYDMKEHQLQELPE